MLKKSCQRYGKVKAGAKAEMKKVRSSLNLDLSLPRVLRPCLGKGASQGEESVLADSGREGEITARAGRVRSLAFLSILRDIHLLSMTCEPLSFLHATIVFPQPATHKKADRCQQPALFMTVRREIAEPRRETGARSPEDPMRTRAVR